jgi:hypothetical protein
MIAKKIDGRNNIKLKEKDYIRGDRALDVRLDHVTCDSRHENQLDPQTSHLEILENFTILCRQ